jgi:hypothetical protein
LSAHLGWGREKAGAYTGKTDWNSLSAAVKAAGRHAQSALVPHYERQAVLRYTGFLPVPEKDMPCSFHAHLKPLSSTWTAS